MYKGEKRGWNRRWQNRWKYVGLFVQNIRGWIESSQFVPRMGWNVIQYEWIRQDDQNDAELVEEWVSGRFDGWNEGWDGNVECIDVCGDSWSRNEVFGRQ